MNVEKLIQMPATRREFLARSGAGFGTLGLAGLLADGSPATAALFEHRVDRRISGPVHVPFCAADLFWSDGQCRDRRRAGRQSAFVTAAAAIRRTVHQEVRLTPFCRDLMSFSMSNCGTVLVKMKRDQKAVLTDSSEKTGRFL